MPECRSCKARILWVKTEKGGTMPLDEVPVADGNISLKDGVAFVIPKDTAALIEGPLYKSHFATCVNAKQHRKEKK